MRGEPPGIAERLRKPGYRWSVAIGLALGLVAVIEAVWRLRFETNDEVAFAYAMMGRDLIPAQTDLFYYLRGLAELLVPLERWFGPTAYGVFLLGLLVAAAARWFERLLAVEGGQGEWPRRLAVVVASFYVLAITLSQINFTRVAFLASFVGFYALSAAWSARRRDKSPWIDVPLVVVGFALRPQAGLLAMGICALLWLFAGIDRRRLLRQGATALAIVAAFHVYTALETSDEEREYFRRAKLATPMVDGRAVELLPPESALDEIRLRMFWAWLFFDDDAYNSEFLSRHARFSGAAWTAKLRGAGARIEPIVHMSRAFAGPLLALLVLWAAAEALAAGGRRGLFTVIGKTVSVLLFVLLLDLFFGTRARVLEPVLAALMLGLLAASLRRRPAPWLQPVRRQLAALLVVVGLVAAALAARVVVHADERAEFDREYAATTELVRAVETVLADRIILAAVLDPPLKSLFVSNRPLAIRLPAREVDLLFIQGWLTQSLVYRRAIDELGGGKGVAGLLRRIESEPGRFVFLGRESTLELFLEYAAVAYGSRLAVEERSAGALRYFEFTDTARAQPSGA